jgi:lysyl-tRNA synthetase class 1
VRAYGVKLALQEQGYVSELIAYSDDLDGLRKVPDGLPDWLKDHIATPVSQIPDPFGCHPSYGAHMSSLLLDALDKLSVEYRPQSGAEAYRQGLLNPQIVVILENATRIGEQIRKMLGQTKFEEVLPYYPICEKCGRIYLAEAYNFDASTSSVEYRCRGAEIGRTWIDGCGHEGRLNIAEGKGKLSWKSEFAARWAALDIRFEAYGKDIADSVRVNDWVAKEILGYEPPYHVRYELFLDKSGRKISKSLGNVFTPQLWLRYGTPASLLLLMFKRIAGTRNVSVEDVPNYMDEFDALEDLYFGRVQEANALKLRKLRGLYEYVNRLAPPSSPDVHVPYRLLVQIATVAPEEKAVEFVTRKLLSYGSIKEVTESLRRKITLAAVYAAGRHAPETVEVVLSPSEKDAVRELVEVLERDPEPEAIQTSVFEAARRHGVQPSSFFKTLYLILIGAERGPRLGPYIKEVGPKKVAEALANRCRQ